MESVENEDPVAPQPPQQSSAAKWSGTLVEAGASAIPLLGGPLAVAIATVFGYAYGRRVDKWREDLTSTVQYLIDHRGVSVEDLADDDEFLDAVATATRVAATTSSEQKRQFLRNALTNIGLGHAPDADKQAVYLRYIEELTPSHMRLLEFMNDPPGYCSRHEVPWTYNGMMGGLGTIVDAALPDLAADKPFLDTLAGDLTTFGLISSPGFNTIMSATGLAAGRGTPKGTEFITFISAPDGAA